MSKFKTIDFKVNPEPDSLSEVKIIQVDKATEAVIKPFQFTPLKKEGESDYKSVKTKYGPLAATDPERAARTQKDRRFSLNPLLRDPLSVEQEERRVIEEKVRARINALAEDAKDQASKVGYQEGLKQGYEEASEKMRQEASSRLESLEHFLKEVENAKITIFQANERFLIELIYRIARMVILRELSTDRDYLLRLAKELINRVGVKDNITLRIHPDDSSTLETLKDGLHNVFKDMKNLNIESSSQVKRGGCQVETEWNAIESSVESQLQGIYESLFGKVGGET